MSPQLHYLGENMQSDWLFIGIIFLLAPIFPAMALLIPRLVAPKKPDPLKSQTYECGIETVGDTWVQFKTQYYNFGLIFLISFITLAGRKDF